MHARIGAAGRAARGGPVGDDVLGLAVDHDAAVGDGEDTGQLVRHNDDRSAEALVELQDELVELGGGDRVEAGRGSSKNRIAGSSASARAKRGALPHAAGELGNHVLLEAVELDHAELDAHQQLDRLRRQRRVLLERQSDVLAQRQRTEQRAGLEGHAELALDALQLLLVGAW